VVLILLLGAGSFHLERERGILRSLLAKPISRVEFVLGKYAGTLVTVSAVIILMALVHALVVVASGAKFTGTMAVAVYLTLLESLRWRLPESGWGRYTLRADVSHLDRFEQRRDSTAPAISSLSRNGLPRTRAAGGVFWQRLAWQAGLQANYISGFGDSSAPRETDGGLFRVGSWIGINLFVSYRLEHTALPETELRLGSNNLFDRAPPLADEDRGFDQLVHDARGRYLYAEIRCRW
jgi:hypothetical protein